MLTTFSFEGTRVESSSALLGRASHAKKPCNMGCERDSSSHRRGRIRGTVFSSSTGAVPHVIFSTYDFLFPSDVSSFSFCFLEEWRKGREV